METMLSIRTLSARAVRFAMKSGLGFQDLCDKYGCTAEELESRLETLFSKGAPEITSKLRDTTRKKERKESRRNQNSVMPPRGPFRVFCTQP